MIQPFELLENVAARYPKGVGLVSPIREFTFLEMLELSQKLAEEFSKKGVRPRHTISTFLQSALDWLATLAAFHEAAVPVSLWGTGNVSNLDVAWFISQSFRDDIPKKNTILLDLESIEKQPPTKQHPRTLYSRPDIPMRYVLTSGTTGEPKVVNFSGDTISSRLAQLDTYWADSRPELNFMGLSTTGGFFSALAALRHGYPYLAEGAIERSSLERAREHKIQVLAGSPNQIGKALQLITKHNIKIPTLVEVRTAGSSPSERLVTAVHEQLGVPLKSVYGSTEGGGIAFNTLSPGDDVSIAGSMVSGVELEISKEDTEANEQAEAFGKIRYRGKGLASGYVGPIDSDSSFHDGWFYPGDAGYFDFAGRLVLAGRTDELLNVGGTKVNPSTIEDSAVTFSEVSDAAICLIERVPGVEEVAIGISLNSPFDSRRLDQELRSKFPTSHPTIFMAVNEIPRNQMGKIMREELKAQILKELSGS